MPGANPPGRSSPSLCAFVGLELDYCSQRRTKKEARHERCFINSSVKVALRPLDPRFTPTLVYRLNPQNVPSAAFDPAADDPVIRLGRQHERLSNLLHCNRMSAVCLCSAPACVLQELPPPQPFCRAVTGCRRKQEHHCSSLNWQVQSRPPPPTSSPLQRYRGLSSSSSSLSLSAVLHYHLDLSFP